MATADRLLVVILPMLLSWPAVAGTNPYLEQVRQSAPDADALQESREKLQTPLPEPLEEPLAVAPFHKASAPYAGSAGVLCGICHQAPPHRRHEEKRSFLNHHTTFIACETCHWRPENVRLEYRPVKLTDATGVDADADAKKPLVRPGFRIAPFYQGDAITLTSGHPFAQTTARQWKEADDEEKAVLRARLHAPLAKDKMACGDCHREDNPLFHLESLGATPERQHAFMHNPIAAYLDKRDADETLKPIHLMDLLE